MSLSGRRLACKFSILHRRWPPLEEAITGRALIIDDLHNKALFAALPRAIWGFVKAKMIQHQHKRKGKKDQPDPIPAKHLLSSG
jgi:hypothetical protein